MAKALLQVCTNPASAAVEGEFNEWYDAVHLGELIELVPGIVAASRYRVDDLSHRTSVAFREGDPDEPLFPHRYAALYEIDADDPEAVVRDIRIKASEGRFRMSPALDAQAAPPAMILLTPTGAAAPVGHPEHSQVESAR